MKVKKKFPILFVVLFLVLYLNATQVLNERISVECPKEKCRCKVVTIEEEDFVFTCDPETKVFFYGNSTDEL